MKKQEYEDKSMTIVKPFKAIRPNKKVANQVAALPYDVYSSEEAREEVKGKPLSFLNIDRAETGFSKEVNTYDDCVYQRAADLFTEMRTNQVFIQEETPCYYIYQLTMDQRPQTGIVACAAIDDYLNAVVKKHENTRADKEQDRIHHVDKCNAQTGPIFLAYQANQELAAIVTRIKENLPIYDFISADGVGHTVWIVNGESDIQNITSAFSKIAGVYIADGHHRAASAVKVGMQRREKAGSYTGNEEFNYFLSVLFPSNELKILDYNRVVVDLNGYTKAAFLDKVREQFIIVEQGEQAYRPEAKGRFGMYLDNKWYSLTAKDQICSNDPVDGLDVAILQNYLLEPILGIKDPKIDERISFVGGIRGLEELKKDADKTDGIAFSMYPTDIKELFAVADAGELMPPKSTWFEPKLRSGLFIHEI